MNLFFVVNSILLGVGLAMDAFSVSLANGLNDPGMNKGRMSLIAGTFAGFQFLMPMLGWICVHSIVKVFEACETYIPWIAFFLLLLIGINMIKDGVYGEGEESNVKTLSLGILMMQGVATSIDALSVGFTIAGYAAAEAFICSLIIAAVTFVICVAGLILGRRFGILLAGRAQIFGGALLIAIGLEILLSKFLF
ncbi:manganese efflux pump MntP [Schwartzia succinivorans]|uniref:Putative manganese efflux pump MntP n=1 Tax=Schwartzia succinivorans DSM 10502 TaxID=1123243 RepID=A0A1M4SQZ8_9FIRM|nr:manganese efflux pump [Schwartzia succinivorans]SHE34673.1 Putative Mn2+ efflux pump MntP [Schwartzia succinivorans DSM 10502]